MVSALIETFGFNPAVATAILLFSAVVTLVAVYWFVQAAPPRTIVLTSGPPGSTFQRYADSYAKILARNNVTLRVLPSQGSLENLQRLWSGKRDVDIGFAVGGISEGIDLGDLTSLGSVAHQPLWVFYRTAKPISRLSDLAGQRIAVGALGSGARSIAHTLLQANGVTEHQATFVDLDADAAATALQDGKLEAVFLMGDSAPIQTLRNLLHSPDIKLYSFVQADGYVRRHTFLDRIELPEGSIDLGKNLPPQDVILVGPTVELIARKGLHPALCELLVDVAKEVHGKAGVLQKRGEFPAPLEHEFNLNEDAIRYYKSGKGFVARAVGGNFWLASLTNRILIVFVPIILVLVPAIRFLPFAYRWCIQLRIIRCYRPLLLLEREVAGPLTHEQGEDILRRLDMIEATVNHLKVPASFADQFYVLRVHVAFVRDRLKSTTRS